MMTGMGLQTFLAEPTMLGNEAQNVLYQYGLASVAFLGRAGRQSENVGGSVLLFSALF